MGACALSSASRFCVCVWSWLPSVIGSEAHLCIVHTLRHMRTRLSTSACVCPLCIESCEFTQCPTTPQDSFSGFSLSTWGYHGDSEQPGFLLLSRGLAMNILGERRDVSWGVSAPLHMLPNALLGKSGSEFCQTQFIPFQSQATECASFPVFLTSKRRPRISRAADPCPCCP